MIMQNTKFGQILINFGIEPTFWYKFGIFIFELNFGLVFVFLVF